MHSGGFYSTDRSKAVVPVLVLLFGALWFVLRGELLYVLPCAILFLCFFSPFSIAITSLGEERANLSAFRMWSICACLDLSALPSSWCLGRAAICDCGTPWTFSLTLFGASVGLRLLILALPGLFSYLCLSCLPWVRILNLSRYLIWLTPLVYIISLRYGAAKQAEQSYCVFTTFEPRLNIWNHLNRHNNQRPR